MCTSSCILYKIKLKMEKERDSKIVMGLLIGIILILSIMCIMLYIQNKKNQTNPNLNNNQNTNTNNPDSSKLLIISTDNQEKSLIVSNSGGNIKMYYNDSTTFYKREVMTNEEYNKALEEYNSKMENIDNEINSQNKSGGSVGIPTPVIQDKLLQLKTFEELNLQKDDKVEIPFDTQGDKNIALSIIKL
jgi:cell division protein FtsI/penicillin-binding protein 2